MKDIVDILENQRNFLVDRDSNDPGFKNARSPEGKFNLVEKEFPWGKRKIYIPIDQKYNENLQGLRGIPFSRDASGDEMKSQIFSMINDIQESDTLRIKELDYVIDTLFDDREFNSFCEIGFRIPRLQNFYRKRGMKDRGFDINRFNVKLGKSLGFDCRLYDLNDEDTIDISDCDLIVCYHVLEHISDPFEAVKLLYKNSSPRTLFHIEIPVEPDGPRLRYSHLYPFFSKDMHQMLELSGFKILTMSSETHTGGPWVERYSAIKE